MTAIDAVISSATTEKSKVHSQKLPVSASSGGDGWQLTMVAGWARHLSASNVALITGARDRRFVLPDAAGRRRFYVTWTVIAAPHKAISGTCGFDTNAIRFT